MPQMSISLASEENDIIEEYKIKWSLSKPDTIKRIIKEFGENN